MTISVVNWLDNPSDTHGIYFADDADGWGFQSYSGVASGASRVAQGLRDVGVGRNDLVVTALPSSMEFVSTCFGAWVAGASVCPVIPPGPFEDEGKYLEHIASLIGAASPSAVVTDSNLVEVVKTAVSMAGVETAVVKVNECSGALPRAPAPEIALVQFTSGSTGTPRGVCVSVDNLDANIRMIRSWVEWDSHDATASWLPLFHDMGLIGCLFASAASQTDLYVLRPDQFIRNPARWIRCFDAGGATLTAAPSFAFGYVAKRLKYDELDGIDLSHWKTAVVGAEPIDGASLCAFSNAMQRFKFSSKTFRAAYGLAEATLAATGLELGRSPRAVRLVKSVSRIGEAVQVQEDLDLNEGGEAISPDWLVSCGLPFDGVRVEIIDQRGRSLPEGVLGQITLRGPLVARGYLNDEDGGQTRFDGNLLFTGDAGFILGSELFVLGRIGESVKVRGRNVFVEDVESRIAANTELSPGQFAMIAAPGSSGQGVLLISERPLGPWVTTCRDIFAQELGGSVSVKILCCQRGTIRRTSSGKPRRRLMWELYVGGEISGAEVGVSGDAEQARAEPA